VFVVLALVVFKAGYEFGSGISVGLSLVEDNKDKIKSGNKPPVFISEGDFRNIDLIPTKAMLQPDSIWNEKESKFIPILYTQALARVSEQQNIPFQFISTSLHLIGVIAVIIALVFFIRLIMSINKSQIFDWQNVKRLRIMGYTLLVSYLCTLIPAVMTVYTANGAVKLEKYIFSPSFLVNLPDLFLVLGCLIVAEIFSIGLKMKEEQELTI